MMRYDYRVLPAPNKGQKTKGAKTPEDRFAAMIETRLNAEAEEGWEFLRAETLPSIERQGLTGSKTVYQTLLVFRRPADASTATEPHDTPETPATLEDHGTDAAVEDTKAAGELRAER